MIKSILIADDDPTTAMLLARRLEKEGYEVFIAGNGLEALKMVDKQPVDLIISDVVMPEMDGVDLYMQLKADPDTANIPIIIVTDKEVFQESFSSLGVELYCPKPFNIPILLEKIKLVEQKQEKLRVYHKIVVIGPDKVALNKMHELLIDKDCIVDMVDNVIEIGLRCFLVNPHLILMDIHSREYATTKEIIRSLRSYKFFENAQIVIYSNFEPELGRVHGMEAVEMEINACLNMGANKYIGRFNPLTFLDHMKEFGI